MGTLLGIADEGIQTICWISDPRTYTVVVAGDHERIGRQGVWSGVGAGETSMGRGVPYPYRTR